MWSGCTGPVVQQVDRTTPKNSEQISQLVLEPHATPDWSFPVDTLLAFSENRQGL
jgi:hypothetical protein